MSQKGVCAKEPSNSSPVWSRQFISSDKVSPLPWAVQQPLYHMVYETSVQQGRAAPAGFIILVASQAKLTALSPCSFWLPHRLKPSVITPHPHRAFQGSGLFVPTLSSRGGVVALLMQRAGQFYSGCVIVCRTICDRPPSCRQHRPAHHTAHASFWLEHFGQN